jgi:hypothetical protein
MQKVSTAAILAAVMMGGMSEYLVPARGADFYVYLIASPNIVEKDQKTTLTLGGYIYKDGEYDVSVKFLETDTHDNVATPSADDPVGSCETSVTVKKIAAFKCAYSDAMPAKFIDEIGEGNIVEFIAVVTINGEEWKTSYASVYCNHCSLWDSPRF